jgi:signal transduction histidine kinase
MHRILARQIKKTLGSEPSEETPLRSWESLLDLVNETYTHADMDRELLSRSLDLSSKEFVELNKRLQQENEIIEQKVADRTAELTHEQTKLNTIARYMDTGAILIDPSGAVQFANRAILDLLNNPSLPETLHALIQYFPSVSILDWVDKAQHGESNKTPETEVGEKVFSLSFASLSDATGVFGVLIWIDDVTAQSLLNRAKNQFIAIASHEMRTPLAIIRGNAELMLDEPIIRDTSSLADQTDRILKNAIRLLGIVNDFLDLQNLETRRILLKPEPVDIIALLTETISDFSDLSDEKNLTLQLEADPTLTIPPVVIDRARLQQICVNFISNGLRYTEKGGVTVRVEKNNEFITILVIDTGVGIDAEDQKRMFKKFSTAKAFLKTKEYGSGLGLYICGLLADAIGCTVGLVSSEVGVGSTFSLKIPLTVSVAIAHKTSA